MRKKLLNVGGGSKQTPIPEQYSEYRHDLLDIDMNDDVDIACDARLMKEHLLPSTYDVVYCAHNLEHYYDHEVSLVLEGMRYALRDGGAVHIIVPNIGQLIHHMVEGQIDLEDRLYECAEGPITPLDVLYGYGKEIEESGEPFYAHKTGFTAKRLHRVLAQTGFEDIKVTPKFETLELEAFGKSPGRKSFLSSVGEAPGHLYLPDSCAVRGV